MEIETVAHKALRRFIETGNPRGLDGQLVDRLTKMIVFLMDAGHEDHLLVPPNFGTHKLTGDRHGEWAMTVTRNWRLTFRIVDGKVYNLNLEDYH